jgi:hypothetical protein
MLSSPPVGAIAFGLSGIACTVAEVQQDRVVLLCPDGVKQVRHTAIARWELPPITRALAVGDRTITTKPIETRQAHIIVGTRGVVLMPSHQAYGLIRVKLEDVEYPVDLSLDEIRLAL